MAGEKLVKLGFVALGLEATAVAGLVGVLLVHSKKERRRGDEWSREYAQQQIRAARDMLQALEGKGLTGELPIVDVVLDNRNETRGRDETYRALKVTWGTSSDARSPKFTSWIDSSKAMICLHPEPIPPTMFLECNSLILSIGRVLFRGFENGRFDSVATNASKVKLNLGPDNFNRLRQSQSTVDSMFTSPPASRPL